jgi:hypothetical protein
MFRVRSLFVLVRSLFVLVRCLFVVRLFVVRLFVVCWTTSPAMADCYVPSSAFVRCLFSFVLVRSLLLFVCHSLVRRLFDHLTRHG